MPMIRLFLIASLLVAGCRQSPPQANPQVAEMRTIDSIDPKPVVVDPPPMLSDEMPAPKPKVQPWETPEPIVMSPEDEKLRASLPFTPAIAMDPVDGSKISIRAATPTIEFKNKIYYFSSEANKRIFASNPEQYTKTTYLQL